MASLQKCSNCEFEFEKQPNIESCPTCGSTDIVNKSKAKVPNKFIYIGAGIIGILIIIFLIQECCTEDKELPFAISNVEHSFDTNFTDTPYYYKGTIKIKINKNEKVINKKDLVIKYSIDGGQTWQSRGVFRNFEIDCNSPYKVSVKAENPKLTKVKPTIKTWSNIKFKCIGAPPPPTPKLIVEQVIPDPNAKKITIYAKRGTNPYKYSIDNGVTFSDKQIFNNLDPGEYFIQVMDSSGIMAAYPLNPVKLEAPPPPGPCPESHEIKQLLNTFAQARDDTKMQGILDKFSNSNIKVDGISSPQSIYNYLMRLLNEGPPGYIRINSLSISCDSYGKIKSIRVSEVLNTNLL